MSEPKVDRDAWAREVERLIAEESGGNKSAFARRIGVGSVKTVDRWLTQAVNVSEESVRAVCRALNLPVAPMLVTVGFIAEQELPQGYRPADPVVEDDEAIKLIRESDAPPSLKRELIEHLLAQRAEHQRQRLAEAQRMLELGMRGRKRAG